MSGPLTSERIAEIVGRLGRERVLQIVNTGASERELIEAKILGAPGWCSGSTTSYAPT